MWTYAYNGKGVEKRRAPLPEIRPNDVLVKIHRVSICGSDFHIFANDDWARETIPVGMVIGHEGCGFVEETGSGVSSFQVGDYVALESHYACPSCEKEGKTADGCPHYGIIGVHGTRSGILDHQVGGVFSEYAAIPHYCCHKINPVIYDALSPSLLEPAGNSWEILRLLRNKGLPENLAVYGCGPHGLNLQLFARHAGVKNIVAFDTDPWRLDFAKRFGAAHHLINPKTLSHEEMRKKTSGQGFDVAIDMVGNISVVEDCEALIREGGMVILFGLPRHEANVAHGENFAQIIFNNEEIEMEKNGKRYLLRGFTGRSQATWRELIAALESSEFLRGRLSLPLNFIGSLNELEHFIKNPPLHYLKNGMTAFEAPL